MKTIVITGSSSGIGKSTAKYFAAKGWNVAASMRHPSEEQELHKIKNIKVYYLDVIDGDSVSSAVGDILEDFGSVDVVVNNAGYGLFGAFEAATPRQIQNQFEVNVFGLMRVTNAFLPHFRQKKSGLFMNISSVGGLMTFPLISLYHSSKWAVEGFSESLAFELRELGIGVKIIEPGAVSTDFGTRSLVMAHKDELGDYNPSLQKVMNAFANRNENRSTPEMVADRIYHAATDRTDQLRYVVGGDAEEYLDIRKDRGDEGCIEHINRTFLGD